MNAALLDEFRETVLAEPAKIALVLGSGLSSVADHVRPLRSIPFTEIPTLAKTSVAGHKGRLTFGVWSGVRVLLFEGRLHYYEGHAWENVVSPVRIAAQLGVQTLLLTNAAGGIHPALGPGAFMPIRDHIEWTRAYCWRHPGPGSLAATRPSPYSSKLLQVLIRAAADLRIDVHPGVYAAVTGPSYETPAEIRALKAWGADAVGMSTAREIQAGCDLGVECGAISCITNLAAGLAGAPLSHEDVLHTAAAQRASLVELLGKVIELNQ